MTHMKQTRTLEIAVGLFMAVGLVALFFLAMQVSNLANLHNASGYRVTARFGNIGGLKAKSPVTMAGVTIGRVIDIGFDQQTYEAIVTMNIEPKYNNIPDDTLAKIFTAGLLGEKYIGLEAGGSETFLTEGGRIHLTQSSLVLEDIIGQFLYSKAQEAPRG
jgi:phospholipid/cholesterol/gamma-HCH transport system substrate-binding protein